MTSKRLSWTTLMIVLWGVSLSGDVDALANRVFVSARSGNNANACDNIVTPCQTFAGAVVQLNPGGEAIVLDTGGYGPVTITQALTIEAAQGVTGFVHPPLGDAITVTAGALDKVVLRGLVLNGGSGTGIVVNSVGTLQIESCVISGFANEGIFVASAGETFIKDTTVRQNALDGADFFAGRVSIDHCRFAGNGVEGVFINGADVTVRDSVAADNLDGFFVLGAPAGSLNVDSSTATHNQGDGVLASNAGAGVVFARVANSLVDENAGVGLNNFPQGGTVTFETLANSLVRGNVAGNAVGTVTVAPQ